MGHTLPCSVLVHKKWVLKLIQLGLQEVCIKGFNMFTCYYLKRGRNTMVCCWIRTEEILILLVFALPLTSSVALVIS